MKYVIRKCGMLNFNFKTSSHIYVSVVVVSQLSYPFRKDGSHVGKERWRDHSQEIIVGEMAHNLVAKICYFKLKIICISRVNEEQGAGNFTDSTHEDTCTRT